MATNRCPVAIVLLLAVSTAQAATTIHKCALPGGRVVYQGHPCSDGLRTLARWDAPVDATPGPLPDTAAKPAKRARRSTRASGRRASAARALSADPCAAAKERRDAIERRVGLSRTYELLSALQRDVYDACR